MRQRMIRSNEVRILGTGPAKTAGRAHLDAWPVPRRALERVTSAAGQGSGWPVGAVLLAGRPGSHGKLPGCPVLL